MAARVGLAPTPNGLTGRRATFTPPGNGARGRNLTFIFGVRSATLCDLSYASKDNPSALETDSGHYFDRARSLPERNAPTWELMGCAGNAPAGRDARRIYSPPRLFNGLTARNWSPVLELHQRTRFCRPLPVLLG